MTTAFVLGGGGILGAFEVGMLLALDEAGIQPDLILGTSIGAINGVFVAADPKGAADQLGQFWRGEVLREAFAENVLERAVRLARSGTHLHSIEPLRRMLTETLPVTEFSELAVPFHCVAASIESATARWFSSGPLVPAVLASCAVPGLLPPVAVDGEHYFDGGLVDSIPVGRAVALGATTIYVLHVGRIERPLEVPRRPWQVGLVAFEISRRHRFHEEVSAVPDGVTVHVLPTGVDQRPPDLSQLRYRDKTMVGVSIERAHAATASYLAAVSARLPPSSRSRYAPAEADPPDGPRTARGHHRGRDDRAVPALRAADRACRPARAVAARPDAGAPAAVLRADLAVRRRVSAVHVARPVDR